MRLYIFLILLFVSNFSIAQDRVILIVGDSISAAYGITLEQSWVSLFKNRLQEQGYRYQVINASISGETSAGGKQRIARLIEDHKPDVCLLELGGNDGLRGLSLTQLRTNLDAMIRMLLEHNTKVVLLPMKLPPNYGRTYNERFEQIYTDLSQVHELGKTGFILEGIAGDADKMQDDGIHPRAHVQEQMLENVWPVIETVLSK